MQSHRVHRATKAGINCLLASVLWKSGFELPPVLTQACPLLNITIRDRTGVNAALQELSLSGIKGRRTCQTNSPSKADRVTAGGARIVTFLSRVASNSRFRYGVLPHEIAGSKYPAFSVLNNYLFTQRIKGKRDEWGALSAAEKETADREV